MTAIRGGALGAFASATIRLRPTDCPARRHRVRHSDDAPVAGPHGDGFTGLGGHAATGAAAGLPHCPPDCGAVAAGDPLLVGFMTANPGVGWQAFPAAESQSYVNTLRRNLSRSAGTGDHECGGGAVEVGDRWLRTTDHARLVDLAGEGPPSEPPRRRRRPVLVGRRSPNRLTHPHPRDPRLGGGHMCLPTEFPGQRRGRRRLHPGQRRRPDRDQLAVERQTSTRSSPCRPPTSSTRPSHRAESPSRAVVSMWNGSACGSASSPPWGSASWPAPAGEGAGGDPSRRSPRPSDGGRWPSGCPSWRWSAPWPSPCSIPRSCASSASGTGSPRSVTSGRTGPTRPT